MRISYYLRRSTEEHQMESLALQQELSGRFARAQGWQTDSPRVFPDDAISRAEFKKRPGLIAMLNAAEQGELDIVITRDETRLGGDSFRTGLVMQDLLDAGVRLFYYSTGEEVLLDTAVDKFMVSARNFASELEREKTSQRTREHLESKARRGLNVGGRVFGYDNVEVEKKSETGRRRVEYRINEGEAEIVRQIFRWFISGLGFRAIAKRLNRERVPSPRAGKRGTGSWSPSVVWFILRNERYLGVVIWGRLTKSYKKGTKIRSRAAAEKVLRTPRPELRIIDDELWAAAQERIAISTRLTGKAGDAGPKPRYLLTSLARCSECGGPINATNGKDGKKTIKVYACSWHRNRGDAVCKNTLRRPVERVDAAVVGWMQENVLREEVVVEVLRELRARLAARSKSSDSEVPKLEAEAKKLRAETARLVEALAASAEKPAAVMRGISDREARLAIIKGNIEAAKAVPSVLNLEVKRMEQEALKRMSDFQGLLERNTDEGRKVLSAILSGPLKVTPVELPEGKRFRVEGDLAFGTIFALDTGCERVASGVQLSLSPTGFEPVLPA